MVLIKGEKRFHIQQYDEQHYCKAKICKTLNNLYGESSLVTQKHAALCKDDIKTKIDG